MNDRAALEWLSDARTYAQEAHEITSGLTKEIFDTRAGINLRCSFA